jgi:arylsulfatase A-like enzyme
MNTKPNIVFIITDQQRVDTIAAAGYSHMQTPNLDRLVQEGVFFNRMYVTAPSCAPSRASLFTGLYPHNNGVLRNDEPWPFTWVQHLAEAGYRCVNVGKMHTQPFERSFGFHERHVVENKDRANPELPFYLDNWDKALRVRGFEKPTRVTYRQRSDYQDKLGAFVWSLPDDMHADNFVGAFACHWLDKYNGNEPFFLEVGFPGPHPPYDPTANALAAYDNAVLPEALGDADDIASQPYALKMLRQDHIDKDHDAVVHLPEPTAEQIHRQRAHYYANVTMIDTQVGDLLDALEKRGVLDNTVVIFTSDHGDCLNDHGHSQKWTMYESSVRVPAIIWGAPGVAPRQQIEAMASLMDLGPTVLELAGLAQPAWMDAQSLLPLLRAQNDRGREQVFAEHARDKILEATAFMTMIRDNRWKLVHFVDSEDGQLFDLEADPYELHNLWQDPACAEIKTHLITAILTWRIESGLNAQTWLNGGYSMPGPHSS